VAARATETATLEILKFSVNYPLNAASSYRMLKMFESAIGVPYNRMTVLYINGGIPLSADPSRMHANARRVVTQQ
jgi:hypothetical protein